MPNLRDIALLRLRNQQLLGRGMASPADVVGWLCGVQSQDYAGAKWAIAQRMQRSSDAAIEAAFTEGAVLRTHVLRPTWHFVLPADIRWMLALSAPRIRAALRSYDRKMKLDESTLAKSRAILRRALKGGRHLTRAELGEALTDAGIAAQGLRLAHIVMHAEVDALVCSGPRRGKQFTYALLDERAAPAAELARERALAELARRYFTSHGPALAQDFTWWSGLASGDAKLGLELARDSLSELVVDGRRYWHAGSAKPPKLSAPIVHLLPNYDEHLIAYKERSAAFDRKRIAALGSRPTVLANHLIALDGRVVGGWRRASARAAAAIEMTLLAKLDAAERKALKAAQARLARYSG